MRPIKTFSILILLILALNIAAAEILIQTTYNTPSGQQNVSGQESQDTHTFIVNKYYLPSQQETQQPISSIVIEQINSDASINRCEKANFSFKLINPTLNSVVYSFNIKDFFGKAYITPNTLLSSKQAKIIDFSLEPDCSLNGDLNPKVSVETEDEEAQVPVIISVADGNYIEQSSCAYYYNKSICDSKEYIDFYEGKTYKIDLSEWFYDPDGDKLQYSFKNGINLDIKIKGNTAELIPKKNWFGTENIVFYAKDGKGGQAISKKFYIHVIQDEGSFSLFDFFSGLFS